MQNLIEEYRTELIYIHNIDSE